jgi:ATP-dependent RNA helicase DbpA
MQFSDLSLSPTILTRLSEIGFSTPTEIQKIAIPELCSGTDAIIRAETGSGKTAAYGLPLLSKINPEKHGIGSLILVPTRELAIQVQKELKNFALHIPNLKISAFYGGHPFDTERKSLKHPPGILIATPGRLADHLRRDTVDLSGADYFVIDEADKLLEMGFEEEVKFILKYLPVSKQVILLSATFPEALENLSRTLFKQKPVRLETDKLALPAQIEHFIIDVPFSEKLEYLEKVFPYIFKKEKESSLHSIIFCNTREKSKQIAQNLTEKKFSVGLLHGEMEQPDRDKAMARFRNLSTPILVATDLASRGIDISTIELVINFEIPDHESAFLHRIGRTGRAGREGIVITLASGRELSRLKEWKDVPRYRLINIPDLKKIFSGKMEEPARTAMTTLHIHAGRKQKISKGDIVGALIAEAGLEAKEIGLIEIFDHFSYVAVPGDKSGKIMRQLQNAKIKGKNIRVSDVK